MCTYPLGIRVTQYWHLRARFWHPGRVLRGAMGLHFGTLSAPGTALGSTLERPGIQTPRNHQKNPKKPSNEPLILGVCLKPFITVSGHVFQVRFWQAS